jgi:SNF2 family DNA or RNA helicase
MNQILALTGTPVQNYPVEIWNLFHFITPGLLGGLQHLFGRELSFLNNNIPYMWYCLFISK